MLPADTFCFSIWLLSMCHHNLIKEKLQNDLIRRLDLVNDSVEIDHPHDVYNENTNYIRTRNIKSDTFRTT